MKMRQGADVAPVMRERKGCLKQSIQHYKTSLNAVIFFSEDFLKGAARGAGNLYIFTLQTHYNMRPNIFSKIKNVQ